MIVKEADASESSGSLTKATTGDVTVNSEVFLIREGILTSQTPYLEILDIIEEFLNILIIFEDEKVSELEFIEKFNASKISDVNNLIITLETDFDKFIKSNSNLITAEDNVFIENFLEKIKKLYKILNLCTILLIKINNKHDLQGQVDTLNYFQELVNDLERLKEYLESKMNAPIAEVEEQLQEPLKLKEPYNTYILVFGIPHQGLFEAEKLSIIQSSLDQNMSLDEIKSLFSIS